MNILIVKLSAIGDVIHTLPSLAALRHLYPDAHMTWVVEEAAADLVRTHPLLDRVIVFPRRRWLADFKKGLMAKTLKDIKFFISDLQSRSYDLVIDFHGLLKSSVVVWLSNGKRKVGYDSWQELSKLFLNEKIPEDMNKHAVDRYLDFPRYLGALVAPAEFIVPIGFEAEASCQALLDACHLESGRYIAVNAVALWKTKLWDNLKFAKLADIIQSKLNIPVVFTGGDRESLAPIISAMTTKGINIGGQTSLPTLASFYKNALAVITTDSGPMHLAAAVGTPVIALFGPTDPERTGPYGTGHTVIRSKLACSPCFLKKCETGQCMKDITPEQVFTALEKLIEKTSPYIRNGE